MNNTTKPKINSSSKRQENILLNQPAIFELRDNPSANIYKGEILEKLPNAHQKGVDAVNENLNFIIEESRKQKLDPNLVAAIFYMENSHGYYGGLAPIADKMGLSRSVLPANIRNMWDKLAHPYENVNSLEGNITAGIRLIKKISERVENPTVERVATLYNSLSQEVVTDYGARVGEIFRTHKWGHKIHRTQEPAKSNTIQQKGEGFNIIIPNGENNKTYHIHEFSYIEKTFLEKAIEHASFSSLTDVNQMKFLSAAYLLDEKHNLQQTQIQTPSSIPYLSAEMKQTLDREAVEANRLSQKDGIKTRSL